MRARRPKLVALTMATTLIGAVAAPSASLAAVDVTRASDGVVWVRGTDANEQVTIDRADTTALRIADSSGAPTSSDGTCTVDAATSTVLCDSGTTFVRAVLAGGTDTLDAREASIAALIFNGGTGADTVRPAGAKFARIWDATTTDTIDLSDYEGGFIGRWNKVHHRVMLRCNDCAQRQTVLLSGRPGTVRLTDFADDVDLRAWLVLGSTRWFLGAGTDRFFGSNRRRSNVFAGDDRDYLVSFAPRDVLRGEDGTDRIADFGGRGDVLLGGAGIDAMASIDRRSDTVDGGADLDYCLAPTGREPRQCDSGTVRRMELATYMPITSQSRVLQALGIS